MRFIHILFFIVLFVGSCYSQSSSKPLIGIIAIPSEYSEYPSDKWSYFASSYVKFIESGGAQVVPLPYDLPRTNLTYLLDRLNGVLFTGGATPLLRKTELSPIGDTLNFVVNYVVQQNRRGNFYPLWGTCMGFQAIGGLLQGSFNILKNDCIGCQKVNKNNIFNGKYKSRLFENLPQDLRQKMQTANLSLFAHTSMFHRDDFEKSYPLNSFLTPVTFSFDEKGKEYVSSYESPNFPIYGTQFHQEKATFEWRAPYIINHSFDSVRLQQHLTDFFVNQTRSNTNSFPDHQQYLISNYQPIVLKSASFSSIYFFSASKKANEEFAKAVKEAFLQQI